MKKLLSILLCGVVVIGCAACTNKQVHEGHEYVDLGLPSGTLWATCNVGATAPEQTGDYFAWGETETKTEFIPENYTYKEYPAVLPLTVDAANTNWGGDWRMPTTTEQDELRCECTWTWINLNGMLGYEVKGKNGNSIFLPAAGCYEGANLKDASAEKAHGYYWSSCIFADFPTIGLASGVYFYSTNYNFTYNGARYFGLLVRPVYSPKK